MDILLITSVCALIVGVYGMCRNNMVFGVRMQVFWEIDALIRSEEDYRKGIDMLKKYNEKSYDKMFFSLTSRKDLLKLFRDHIGLSTEVNGGEKE